MSKKAAGYVEGRINSSISIRYQEIIILKITAIIEEMKFLMKCVVVHLLFTHNNRRMLALISWAFGLISSNDRWKSDPFTGDCKP